jgi:uncharacterized membrane protein YkoI
LFDSLRGQAGNPGVNCVKKSVFVTCVLPAALVLGFVAETAIAYPGAELSLNAKISMQQAIVIAQRARPGTVNDRELEREGGGSGLRYSFDIESGGKTYEVGVDAQTGKVLENKPESRTPD